MAAQANNNNNLSGFTNAESGNENQGNRANVNIRGRALESLSRNSRPTRRLPGFGTVPRPLPGSRPTFSKNRKNTRKANVHSVANLPKEYFVSISFPGKQIPAQNGLPFDTATSEENVKILDTDAAGNFKILLFKTIPFTIPAPVRSSTQTISSTKSLLPKTYPVTKENVEKVGSKRIEHQYTRKEGKFTVPWFNLSYEADIYKLKTRNAQDGDHYFYYFLNIPKANYIIQIDQDIINI